MNSRADYPCGIALDDLDIFLRAHIKDPDTLNDLINHLNDCRNANRLGFRYIHERIMKYRKDFSDYFPFSQTEKAMIDDLFYFWG